MSIEQATPITEKQAAAFAKLVAIANDDFFNEEDGTWLKLKYVTETSQVSRLDGTYKRLRAYKELGISPFPSFIKSYDSIVVVDYLPPHIIQALKECGANVSFALWNRQTRELNGASHTDLPAYDSANHIGRLCLGETQCGFALGVGAINLKHLVDSLANKTAEQHATFLALYAGFDLKPVNPLQVSLKPFDADAAVYASALFDFKEISVNTTREFKLRTGFFIQGVGEVSPETSLCLLGLQLAGLGMAGQIQVDATINFLTQAWEEEDTYGSQMDRDEQLRTIRRNSVALLRGLSNEELPYFRLDNNNKRDGVLEACEWYAERNIPFFTDKNGGKRVVTRAGVAALWIGMSFSEDGCFMQTVTDIKKLSKLLNRGWNAVAISASEGIPGTLGYRPYERAALQIHYRGENITMSGDKVKTLFHNGRLHNNGSGVAYCRTYFSYSVKKTIRGTFNGLNLRKGQTLADVQDELNSQLEKLINSKAIITPNSRKGSKTLLKFNGVNLLEYRGVNQSISTYKEYGASYEVRKLATSNSLFITLTVVYFASDMEIKSTGLGIKAVLKDGREVIITDAEGNLVEWQISYNMETQKGTSARLHLYAEYLKFLTGKPSYYAPESGTIHTPDLDTDNYIEEDLGNGDAPFYKWWAATQQKYYILDWVDIDYFKMVLLGHAGLLDRQDEPGIVEEAMAHPCNKDLRFISPETGKVVNTLAEALNAEGSGVYVSEVVVGILGDYTIQIEVSTPRENTGVQAETLEQVAATYAACPQLGEALIKTGDDNEEAVLAMVAMATNDPTLML